MYRRTSLVDFPMSGRVGQGVGAIGFFLRSCTGCLDVLIMGFMMRYVPIVHIPKFRLSMLRHLAASEDRIVRYSFSLCSS